MLAIMKTVTIREFFHTPSLVKTLQPAQSLVVTQNGKPELVVTKAGKRPRRTLAELEARAFRAPEKVDVVEILRRLR
jgi:hypothetical protein